ALNKQIKFLKECLKRIEKRKDREIDLIECILTAENGKKSLGGDFSDHDHENSTKFDASSSKITDYDKASKSKFLFRSPSRTASNKNDV
ncbi:18690_t:CDS:1, partial [Funneliformis geosporum]